MKSSANKNCSTQNPESCMSDQLHRKMKIVLKLLKKYKKMRPVEEREKNRNDSFKVLSEPFATTGLQKFVILNNYFSFCLHNSAEKQNIFSCVVGLIFCGYFSTPCSPSVSAYHCFDLPVFPFFIFICCGTDIGYLFLNKSYVAALQVP